MKLNEGIVTIKRRINPDEFLLKYIEDNCDYRDKVYNDFVSYINSYEKEGNDLCAFSPRNYATYYYNNIEKNFEDYHYYASGIRAQVADDIHDNIAIVIRDRKKYHRSDICLKPVYKDIKKSFSLENKKSLNRVKYTAKTRVFSPYEIFITFNKTFSFYPILLKEPICSEKTPFLDKKGNLWYFEKNEKYIFREKDIKRVIFTIERGKYFICIVTKVKYLLSNKKCDRDILAGIDTGIRNPFTIYDGTTYYTIRMNQDTIDKISRLEKRGNKLRKILQYKYAINIDRVNKKEIETVYTNNYKKLLNKYRTTYNKIHNIRKNWSRQVALKIVNTYDCIVVDDFYQPVNENKYMQYIRKINYYNRNHAMYDTNIILKEMSLKYYCIYVKSPEKSSRTCSCCGHVNSKLKLGDTLFICKECGYMADRDHNASKNCYDSINNLL